MPTPFDPKIGDWYQGDNGNSFEVVAVNDSDQTIDIQHFGGEVEEVDVETWRQLNLIAVSAPEDWSGPYDDLVLDDFGDIETAASFLPPSSACCCWLLAQLSRTPN